MKITAEVIGMDDLQRNLKGLANEPLQYKILQSIMRDAGKKIASKAAGFASSIKGNSGLKAFLTNPKNIKYKALRREFKRTGIVTGTVAPRTAGANKKYGALMHLFSIGTKVRTTSKGNKGKIEATDFMEKGYNAGWPLFVKDFENIALKKLKSWARRKNFKVQ